MKAQCKWLKGFWGKLFVSVGLAGGFYCGQASAETQAVDQLVQQWLEVEHQTTAIEQQWQQQKPLLEQRKTLLQNEIEQLQKLLEKKQEGVDDVSAQREQLAAQQTELEQNQQRIKQDLTQLESLLTNLAPQLPPPLSEQWQNEAAVLSDASEPSERLQVALAQLSSLLEFDQRISVHQMPISSPNGDTIMVKQLYLGAGNAWFVSPDGGFVGTGGISEGQWQWQFDNNLNAGAINDAIAVFNKTSTPKLVPLPIKVSL